MAIRYLSGINVDNNVLFVDDANNRVGVGTGNPGAPFEVNSNGGLPIIRARYNATYYTDFDSNGIDFRGASQTFDIKDNGSSAIRIASGGNVGIGTTTPTAPLEITNTGSAGGGYTMFNAFYSAAKQWGMRKYGIDNGTGIAFSSDVQFSSTWYNATRIGHGQNANNPSFQSYYTTYLATTSGNVGIGTTSPTYKLDVVGEGRTSDAFMAGGAINIDNNLAIQITSAGAGTQRWIGINKNNGYGLIIGYLENAAALSGVGAYIRQVTSDPIHFLVNNATTAMSIVSSGNVGIGTTAPGYKLEVSGSTLSTEFVFPTSNFNPSAAARSTTSPMSIRMWNNYFNGTGLGSDYGTVLEYYSLSGHVDSQVYFDAAGGSWYRTAPYAGNFGAWQKYITSVDISGTTNYVSKFTGANSIGDSQIFDNGTSVGINTNAFPANTYRFAVKQGTNRHLGIAEQDNELSIEAYNDALNAGVPLRIYSSKTQFLNGNVGIGTTSPSQALHVTGNIRVTGAYYDSSNSAGSSGQVLSSTGSGTAWVNQGEATATSLYDLLPAARVAFNWTGQVVNDTWTTVFSKSSNLLTTGTWMVRMYVSDFATGGGHYTYTYSGMFTWYQDTTNQGGESAASEIYLHRMGHAANASVLYLRTTETAAASSGDGLFQIKGNYSNTSNQTIQFQFVKIF